MEELNKKKKIILPISEEINNINININGYNINNGYHTSRHSNYLGKKKYKGTNNGQDINYYNQDLKIKVDNKIINNNNNLVSRNENNPVKIKKLYDNIKKHNFENHRISEFFTSRK